MDETKTKREAYKYFKKLLKTLDSLPSRKIVFKKLQKHTYGYTHFLDSGGIEKIEIDHTKGELLETIVHELFHAMSIQKELVPKLETWWIKYSSWKQKKTLLQKFLSKK